MDETPPFGSALRSLRAQRGVSLAKLSELVHYSRGYLSRIETGDRAVSSDLARLCDEALQAGGELSRLATQVPRKRGVPRPAQLPADTAHFVGRTDALARLDELIRARRDAAGAVVITAICATAGVGKTALAVHWAHQVQDHFPDGTLFADLRGFHPADPPVGPGTVLDGFLRALAVAPEAIPADLGSRSAMLRTLLHGRRLLMLLDNAASAAQVRPLLPGSPGCLVLITSRRRLTGLIARDGATPVTLERLPEGEALLLLRLTIGAGRVDAAPAAAASVARLCGYLPLALRIAADRAASRPHLTLRDLAVELAAERDRLDLLATGDDEHTTVRSVFSWSYRALPEAAARMFRLLGLHRGTDFSVPAAAAVAGVNVTVAQRLLDVLADTHLIREARPGRYRFHDLLRIYAGERARAEESQREREEALRRLLSWYLHSADAADRVLLPQRRRVPLDPPPPACCPSSFSGYGAALEWCETERANLVAACRHAARAGEHVVAWKLPVSLWGYFDLRKPWADWIGCYRTGLAAVRRVGDRQGEASVLDGLAGAYLDLRRLDEALRCYQEALAISRESGDRRFEASCLNNVGSTYFELKRFDDAAVHFRQALAMSEETGDARSRVISLNNLAETSEQLGQTEKCLHLLQQALELSRKVGYLAGESAALNNIGSAYLRIRRHGHAVGWLGQALKLRRRIGDRSGEADTLRLLAQTQRQAGQPEAARQSWRHALAILEDLGDPAAADLREEISVFERAEPVNGR